MKLREVMTRNPEVVQPTATLEEAARKMDRLDVGPLPVCDGDRLVGLVTDRDITVRATSAGKDPRSATVAEAMTKDLVYCFEDQDVNDAARMMEEKQIRRVPVLSREHRLVGIISLGDVATTMPDDRMKGEVLEKVSEPAKPDR
jgi:CBS domain-containing protein